VRSETSRNERSSTLTERKHVASMRLKSNRRIQGERTGEKKGGPGCSRHRPGREPVAGFRASTKAEIVRARERERVRKGRVRRKGKTQSLARVLRERIRLRPSDARRGRHRIRSVSRRIGTWGNRRQSWREHRGTPTTRGLRSCEVLAEEWNL